MMASAPRPPWIDTVALDEAVPPTFCAPVRRAPGTSTASDAHDLDPVGSASMTVRVNAFCCTVFWRSTVGVAPETVIASSMPPTFISALTLAVKDVVSATPSRLMVPNPGSSNVTE